MRFDKHWFTYRNVLPAAASSVQVTETRRAFYAGAMALLGEMVTMLEPGTEATEADLSMMDEIKADLDRFFADLKAGQA